ncbi:hypothetical protein PR202_ga25478 [Eleusine coracana subsp. coracana]|uniref:Uncharacterized protein n=1 Tax=Eleusine coracana subsp. coracana TaxID=191504 RepID=A0AAV5D9D8_ELECO|nr:hypothetical protein PR202_ga25418 [Eleusine coracana subsp. coracana]GJN07634.1 hypothetical protein PR202_ga25478 [Eleusine coracana subsp. coracana]
MAAGRHCLCFCRFFFLFVLIIAQSQQHLLASGSRKVVTSLPGYNGPLPFYLETGYVEVDEDNGAELFYYFVESESDSSDDNAPFLLWLTGGDRCSVFSGLAYEIGMPCTLSELK